MFKKHYDFFNQGLSSFYNQFAVIKDTQSYLDSLNGLVALISSRSVAFNTGATLDVMLSAADALLS